jgi:hypothetical protein
VPAIEITGVSYVEVAHEFGKIGQLSFHQQMEMVGHEDIGVEFNRIDMQRLGEEAMECFPVFIVSENVPSFISSASYMIHRTRILNA